MIKDKRGIFNQFFKFAVVGGFGTIIHLTLLYLLTEFLGIYYILSSLLGYLIAITFGFILNKTWTFKEHIRDKIFSKYLKFVIICLISLVINLTILYLLTEFLHLYYMISQIIAIGFSLWINFFGNRILTFRK